MDTAIASLPPAPAPIDARTHPLRTRDFRLVWSAYSISAIGSEVTVLALPIAEIE